MEDFTPRGSFCRAFQPAYNLKNMRRISLILCLLLAAASAAPAQAPAPASAPGTGGWSNQPLRPGDLIRLRIWREADMSGDFPVNEEGVAVLPRIGRTRVVGEPPAQLEARLIREYERYLNHSSIEVRLLRRIQVLGAVRTPGLHPVDATMTVSDVLALAGGTTTQGDPDRIELVRGGTRISARLSADTPIAASPIQSGDQIFVPERNWLSRNSAVFAAGLTSLIIAFFTR